MKIKDAKRFQRALLMSATSRPGFCHAGEHIVLIIKPAAVEEWLGGIKRARGTKAKNSELMNALFHHAMRYEWIERNPIKLVRQSAKREKVPDVLDCMNSNSSSAS